MARPLVGDRVKETTQTSGTGPVSLAGAASGFRSFTQEFISGTKCYYLIVDDPTNTVQYEVGIGTFTSGTPNTLSRDTILESTNSNAAVSWDGSTKTVISIANKLLLNSLADALDSDLITAGTSTAYTLATYRPTAGLYEGRFVCCKLHLTNGVAPTLNVDATGAKAIVDINGAAPSLGALVASYYWFKYDATAAKWVVFSPFGYMSANAVTVTGTFALSGDISPTILAASQNDYNPAGLSSAAVIRQDLSASVNITGLQGGADGRIVILMNISSAYNMTLKNASASSSAASRFSIWQDAVIEPGQSATLIYDATASRWKAISIPSNPNVGEVVWFAASAAPIGTLECDGSAVSRTTYTNLFAVVGTTYGTGDGSTTFNLPDLRGEFIRGWDHGRGVDSGRGLGSHQSDDIKSHAHSIDAGGGSSGPQNYISVDTNYNVSFAKTTGATGGTETRPRNVALLPCIRC